jgi:hypothetical protein
MGTRISTIRAAALMVRPPFASGRAQERTELMKKARRLGIKTLGTVSTKLRGIEKIGTAGLALASTDPFPLYTTMRCGEESKICPHATLTAEAALSELAGGKTVLPTTTMVLEETCRLRDPANR